MKSLPSISIVTCAYNCNISRFTKVLESIQMQDYPTEKVEHLVMDGGSENETIALAKEFGCRVYSNPSLRDYAEERASLGIIKSKHELIIFLEDDNIIPSKNWFREMVKPFQENQNIICTFSAYNTYEKNMSLTTKYCALFGIPDPTLYYLKKSEKIRMDQTQYDKGVILTENPDYWTVKFTDETLPTIGDNGHMFRKSVIDTVNTDPKRYIHVDAFQELLENGYDTYGVVKNSIIHVASPTLNRLIAQRVGMKKTFYDGRRGKRKYLTMNWDSAKDRRNLLLFIIFSLTFLEPFFESFRGYLKIRDSAWFLHPFACFLMVIGYGKSEIRWVLNLKKKLY